MGYDFGDVFFVFSDEGVPFEEELGTVAAGGFAEGLKGFVGCLYGRWNIIC